MAIGDRQYMYQCREYPKERSWKEDRGSRGGEGNLPTGREPNRLGPQKDAFPKTSPKTQVIDNKGENMAKTDGKAGIPLTA